MRTLGEDERARTDVHEPRSVRLRLCEPSGERSEVHCQNGTTREEHQPCSEVREDEAAGAAEGRGRRGVGRGVKAEVAGGGSDGWTMTAPVEGGGEGEGDAREESAEEEGGGVRVEKESLFSARAGF